MVLVDPRAVGSLVGERMKYLVLANFRIFIPQAPVNGKPQPDLRRHFTKGMVLTEIPAGHSADDWVAKGHVKAA